MHNNNKMRQLFCVFALMALFGVLSSFAIAENYQDTAKELLADLLGKMNQLSEIKGLDPASLHVKEVPPKLIKGRYFIAKIEHPAVCEAVPHGMSCPHYVVSMEGDEPQVLIERASSEIYYLGIDVNGRPMFGAIGPENGQITLMQGDDGVYVEGEEMLP